MYLKMYANYHIFDKFIKGNEGHYRKFGGVRTTWAATATRMAVFAPLDWVVAQLPMPGVPTFNIGGADTGKAFEFR